MQSFTERLDVAVSALGVQLAPLAFDIARAQWDNPQDMVDFLNLITNDSQAGNQ